MMICDKCGYKTRKNIKYCPQCGIELTETKDSNTKNKFWEYLQKVKKINKIYIIVVIAVILIISLIIVFSNDKYHKFIRNYEKDDIEAIQSDYDKYSERDVEKVYKYLSERLTQIRDDYIQENVTYEETKTKLDKIGESCKSGSTLTDYADCKGDIERLHNLREAIKKAEELYSYGSYEKSLEYYKKVIQSDKNYSEAQAKIEELKPLIAKDYSEKAENSYNSEDYTNAIKHINNAIRFDNNSDYQQQKQKYIDSKDQAEKEKAEKERQQKLLVQGKEISTTKFNIEYEGAAFETRILPENVSRSYLYNSCKEDSIYIDMKFYLTNISDYNAKVDIVKNVKVKYGEKNYTSFSQSYSELGDSTLKNIYSSTYIAPLKKIAFHLAVTLPYEAVSTDDSIVITFTIDGQEQRLEYR